MLQFIACLPEEDRRIRAVRLASDCIDTIEEICYELLEGFDAVSVCSQGVNTAAGARGGADFTLEEIDGLSSLLVCPLWIFAVPNKIDPVADLKHLLSQSN